MKISGTTQMAPQAGNRENAQSMDSVTKNIQRQISNAQKQLQELSSNEEMSMEEKMNKRQEIQKQITELNNQLRQHQIEQRKEKQQGRKSSMEDMLGGAPKAGTKKDTAQGTGMSQTGMQAIISGGSAIKQAKVQGNAAAEMECRAGVLETEIKQDAALGGDTKAKQEELAKAEQTAARAAASQINTLKETNREMEETGKTEQPAEKEAVSGHETAGMEKQDVSLDSGSTPGENIPADEAVSRVSIDVRL